MSAQIKQDESGQLWVRKDTNSCWVKAQRTYNANGELIVHLPVVLPDSDIVVKTQSNTYNGWSNYETWAVNLHLTNDESLYHMILECQDASEIKSFVNDRVESVLYGNSDHLSPSKLMCQDLLTSSLQSVNWYEIYDGLHEGDEEEDS